MGNFGAMPKNIAILLNIYLPKKCFDLLIEVGGSG